MKCKMLINTIPTVDMLRRFYYFDNSIWRMTMIKDWNVSSDKLTDVEFVRVKDISKYTSENPTGLKDAFLSLDADSVALSGGTIGVHIRTIAPDTHWTLATPGDIYVVAEDMVTEVSLGDGDFDGYMIVDEQEEPRTIQVILGTVNGYEIEEVAQS